MDNNNNKPIYSESSCGDCIYYTGYECSGSPDRFGKNSDSPVCVGFEVRDHD